MATIRGIRPMTFEEIAEIPNGTEIENFGANQCVAVVNLYMQGVLGVPLAQSRKDGSFSAHMLWTNFTKDPNLKKHFKRSRKPVKGAIGVWKPSVANGGQGHTGFLTHVYPDGSFNTREQNWGADGTPERWLHKYRRTVDSSLYGFLVPKVNPAVPAKPKPGFRRLVKRLKVGRSRVRAEATTRSRVTRTIRSKGLSTVVGWTRGERVQGSDIWFRVAHGWVHSSRFRTITKGTTKVLKEYR